MVLNYFFISKFLQSLHLLNLRLGSVYLLPPFSFWLYFSDVSFQKSQAVLIVFPNQYLSSVVDAQLRVGRCERLQIRSYKISQAYQSLLLHIETCQQNMQINQPRFRHTLKCVYSFICTLIHANLLHFPALFNMNMRTL